MRWILPLVLLATTHLYAQDFFRPEELASETSESLDRFGYLKPQFEWNMEGKVQASLNDGINYLDEGSPGQALPALEEAIKLAPGLWVAHYYLGVCQKQLRKYKEAEKSFLRVNELNDKNIYNYIELGKTYDLLGVSNKAERFLQRARDIDSKNPNPVYVLANHSAKMGNVDRARRLYKECLDIDPNFLDAGVKVALIEAAMRSNPKHALRYLEDVLAKDSLHRLALLFHGALKLETDKKIALRDFDRLVRLTPTNTPLRLIRGLLYTETDEYDKSFSDLRKVVEATHSDENRFLGQQSELDKRIDIEFAGYYVVANVYGLPDADAFQVRKAYCLLYRGKFDDALKSIGKVSKDSRKTPLCVFLRAVINEHKGEHKAALFGYDSAITVDKDNIDAHKKRGIYFTELQRWDYAEMDFSEMLRINPESYVAYKFRGLSRYHNNKYREAIDDFSRYLTRDSINKEVRAYRGMGYQKVGELLPSTLDLLKSQNPQAIESFSTISVELDKLLTKKDTAKAMWWLDEYIKIEPGFVDAHKYYLKVLMSQEKWDELSISADRALFRGNNTKPYGFTHLPSDLSYFLTAKAIALTNTENAAQAVRELNTAIENDSKNSLAWLSRGKAHLALNNKPAAEKDFQKAAKLGENEAKEMLKGF
ncbi:MAG TPA: tetratricopeptide repeat protein [Cyclobacteriaceae bacterium]|nr:tetratricopeptide repeat protein [Cyclobacteriaceae bacterium]